jgi:hypothetical protein
MGQQLSVSFELICLLDWLCNESKGDLQKLVEKVMSEGLEHRLNKMSEQDYLEVLSRMQEVVINFTNILEDSMELGSKEEIGEEFLKRFLRNWRPPSNEAVN